MWMWSTKTHDGEVHVLVVPPNVPLELLYEPLELVEEFYESRSAYNPSDCVQLFVGDFRTCHKQQLDSRSSASASAGFAQDIDEPLLILLSREEVVRASHCDARTEEVERLTDVTVVDGWLQFASACCYTNVGARGNWQGIVHNVQDNADEE